MGYTIQSLKGVSGQFALYLPLVNKEKISAVGIGNILGKHAKPLGNTSRYSYRCFWLGSNKSFS